MRDFGQHYWIETDVKPITMIRLILNIHFPADDVVFKLHKHYHFI